MSEYELGKRDLSYDSEYGFLREVLGTYSPITYLRTVNVPYTSADIRRLVEQTKTGKPAYQKEDYENAKNWEEKKRILQICTTAYHEAFHHFQNSTTSLGHSRQFITTMRSSLLLRILRDNNGLADRTLTEFVLANASLFSGTVLSHESLLLWGILDGTKLYTAAQPDTQQGWDIFKIIQVPTKQGKAWPQVCLERNGKRYPFGAEALIESWTFNFMRVWVSLALGTEAAAEFTEKMGFPFFPYKVLDYIVEQVCPDINADDVSLRAVAAAIIAYYGLSIEPFDPSSPSLGPGFFPGFRAACLAEQLRQHTKRDDVLFDAMEHAMAVDKDTGWCPFPVAAYSTWELVTAYMSKLMDADPRLGDAANIRHYRRFMTHSCNEIILNLLDSGRIFDAREWFRDYNDDLIERPPISVFYDDTDDGVKPLLRTMGRSSEKIHDYLVWYIIGSIIEQKLQTSTYKCPLGIGRHTACSEFDGVACMAEMSTLDLPSIIARKGCMLSRILNDLKDTQAWFVH